MGTRLLSAYDKAVNAQTEKRAWNNAWRNYEMKCETSYVIRRGTQACGVTQEIDFDDIYRKPEFVAEHEGRTAYLFGLLYKWNCHLLKTSYNPYFNEFGYEMDPMDVMMFLLSHDVGEIACGDALDDGSDVHELARETEEKVANEFYGHLPPGQKRTFKSLRKDFEAYQGNAEVQFMKACDKAEAIAFQLFLYKRGLVGDVTNKNPPSKRDLRFAKIAGSTRSIDDWTVHYRVAVKHMETDLLRPITGFLTAAFLDAFGEIPQCMTTDVTDIELDD